MAKPAVKEKKLDKEEIEAFERGMPLKDLKKMLNKAAGVKDPDDAVDPEDGGEDVGPISINAAVAMCKPGEVQGTKFKKRAVIAMHKSKNGQQLIPFLQDAPGFDRATFAHGSASIDPANSKIVILKLNKENKGIANLLKKAIKGTKQKFVRLCDESGRVLEEDMVDEDTLEPGSSAPDGEAPLSETNQNYWDPSEEKARLMGLAMKIAKVGAKAPDQIGALKGLAQQAQAALATGVEQTAVTAIDALAEAIGKLEDTDAPAQSTAPTSNGTTQPEGPVAPPPAPPPLPPSTAQKSGQAWTMTRNRVGEDITKLGKAIADHYKDQAFVGQLESLFEQKTAPIMTTLDQSLATKLEELGTVPETEKPKVMEDARKILDTYEQFVSSDPLLAQLDDNPFMPLQTKKTLEATVNLLRKRLA